MTEPIRMAVLGCGTIVRSQHLPAVLAHPEIRLVALVDSSGDRAEKLVRHFGLDCKVSTDYRTVLGEVDAVLNSLPNHLHAPITLDALNAGVHVLCEKPLAIKSADARACATTAEQKGLVLAVGMNRRFQDNHPLLRAVLEEQMLGALQGYDWETGGPYDWNSASSFYFSRAEAGGGVVLDYGVHLLDKLVDWFGPVTKFSYADDDWGGGIEANAVLNLRHEGRYGTVNGTVRLSRTYPLANQLLVRGSSAVAELPLEPSNIVMLHRQLKGLPVTDTLMLADSDKSPSASFFLQMENFVRSIRGEEKPRVDGFQAASILELIENCYAQKTRLPEPWSDAGAGTPSGAPA
jgi:UDP-N-acetylglucosamine 3-dehydrogenase